jgi:hypothetical protein
VDPATDFSTAHDVRAAVLALQGAVRLVYAIDITIRSVLARRHVRYLLTHPVAIAAVVLPPVRVIFSLRLVDGCHSGDSPALSPSSRARGQLVESVQHLLERGEGLTRAGAPGRAGGPAGRGDTRVPCAVRQALGPGEIR